MLSSSEKKSLVLKVATVVFLSLVLFSILRTYILANEDVEFEIISMHIMQELLISIIASLFVISVLYLMINKELKRFNTKAMNYAYTDGLTGLYNRHYLNDFVMNFSSSCKEDTSFSIAFMDIDKFKSVNDRLGHSEGDCILKCLALSLNSLTRAKDTLCRYGGEEFLIVFKDISKEDSIVKANEIRESIQKKLFSCKQQSITVSIGLSFGTKDSNIHRVIEEADSALYMAKDAGRNRVEIFNS